MTFSEPICCRLDSVNQDRLIVHCEELVSKYYRLKSSEKIYISWIHTWADEASMHHLVGENDC